MNPSLFQSESESDSSHRYKNAFSFLTDKNKAKALFYISSIVFLLLIGIYSSKIHERNEKNGYFIFGLISSILGFIVGIYAFCIGKKRRNQTPDLISVCLFVFEMDFLFASFLMLLQSIIITVFLGFVTIIGFIIVIWEYKLILNPPVIFDSSANTDFSFISKKTEDKNEE